MYSKKESKQLRHEFWTSFGKSYPKQWILYNTSVKGLQFKFHFDVNKALVALCLDFPPEELEPYWERILSLKTILKSDYIHSLKFDKFFRLSNDKTIAAVYHICPSKLSIHDKNTWQEAMLFMFDSMKRFEAFYIEYENAIKG